jgi:hypothetical protein
MIRIEMEEKAPLFSVTFEQGPLAGQTLTSKLMPCTNMVCECGSMDLIFRDDDQNPHHVRLDAYREAVETVDQDEWVNQIVDGLSEEVSEEDWEKLYNLYYAFKVAGTETLEPSHIEAVFDEKLVEKSVLSSYNAVLPYGLLVQFTLDDLEYELDTYYCLRSGCRCTTADLVFMAERDGRELPGVEPPRLHYNYQTGQYTVEAPGKNFPHTPGELMDGLRAKLPDVSAFLENRHDKFRKMYKGYLKREGIKHGPQPLAIQPSEAGPKVGRNDPCPCRSGKKYKKCCGS